MACRGHFQFITIHPQLIVTVHSRPIIISYHASIARFMFHSLFTSLALIQLISPVMFPHSLAQLTGHCQHHALVHRPAVLHLTSHVSPRQRPTHNLKRHPHVFHKSQKHFILHQSTHFTHSHMIIRHEHCTSHATMLSILVSSY